MGLGIISCQAERVTPGMMDAAILELARSANIKDNIIVYFQKSPNCRK
jgi:malic enzyme